MKRKGAQSAQCACNGGTGAGCSAAGSGEGDPDRVGAHCSMENILHASHAFVKTKISIGNDTSFGVLVRKREGRKWAGRRGGEKASFEERACSNKMRQLRVLSGEEASVNREGTTLAA